MEISLPDPTQHKYMDLLKENGKLISNFKHLCILA